MIFVQVEEHDFVGRCQKPQLEILLSNRMKFALEVAVVAAAAVAEALDVVVVAEQRLSYSPEAIEVGSYYRSKPQLSLSLSALKPTAVTYWPETTMRPTEVEIDSY